MISSLGTALLDEFCWLNVDGSPARPNEVRWGGGGTYAVIGARIWTSDVGLVVHRGPDFPPTIQEQLDSFGPIWQFKDVDTPTPHSLNTYHLPSPTRHFRYLTTPPSLSPSDLLSDPSLTQTKLLHLCCTPSHLIETILPGLSSFPSSPQLVYEPIPFACLPSSLPTLKSLFPHIRLFSPNHEEAGAIFGLSPAEMEQPGAVERVAALFRREGAGDVIVKSGERGAYVLQKGREEGGAWVRPFHRDAAQVKDTVGAGNSFLGGTMAGMLLHPDNLLLAARHGSVSAGIVVESVGLPALTLSTNGEELWNEKSARARLEEMGERDKEEGKE
ncbi:hypothetical protein JCM6882_002069 [Rhodosporidiobolus microsporus]